MGRLKKNKNCIDIYSSLCTMQTFQLCVSGSRRGPSVPERRHNLVQDVLLALMRGSMCACARVRVRRTSWGWGSGCSWAGRRQAWSGWGRSSGSTAGIAPGPGTDRAPGRPPGSSDGPTPAARQSQQLRRATWKMAYFRATVAKRCNYSISP